MISKIFRRLNAVIEETAVAILHLVGHVPIHTVRKAFYIMGGMHVGRGSTVHMGARFYDPKNIHIGEDTIIGEHAVLDGREKLHIGNHVAFGTEVMVYNSKHDINDENFAPVTHPTVIEDHVYIGPRAIIMPGVTVGRGAVVAAAAVVTKDVKPHEIVAGVPAMSIGERQLKDPRYRLGRPRLFR